MTRAVERPGNVPQQENFLAEPRVRVNVRTMKRNLVFSMAVAYIGLFNVASFGAETEDGFKSLMDGKTFEGWKKAEESPDTWKVEDGAFVAHGPRCHLFYVGDEKPFKNFHLKVEVMTEPISNGGIYFHTKYQST